MIFFYHKNQIFVKTILCTFQKWFGPNVKPFIFLKENQSTNRKYSWVSTVIRNWEFHSEMFGKYYFISIYIIKSGVCLFVCGHYNVRTLTSPPILKLWGTQGYLWLPYDLTEVIKLIGERYEPKKFFFQKNTLCHSFRIIVIPSIVLSFLPDYCHSFRIIVIPSVLVSFLPNIVIGIAKAYG